MKDSGERVIYTSGMVREPQGLRPRIDLLIPEGVPYEHQFLVRCGMLMARGALKYAERNWEQAKTQEDLERFKASAARHFFQWLTGEVEEDHAAAVTFNVMAAEAVKYKMRNS